MKHLRKTFIAAITAVLALFVAVMVPMSAQALGEYPSGTSGIDLSFPSCGTNIQSGIPFGIVGVSGGRVYTDNGCAAAEASNFPDVSVYVNTGLDTSGSYFANAMNAHSCGTDQSCGAYWYGYAAGVHAYNYAASQGLQNVRTWWLDVETTNTWNGNTALNVQSILGEHQAIADNTPATTTTPRAEIGVYARPDQWSSIVGTSFGSHAWPVWYATGDRNLSDAQVAQYCAQSYSFTAGPVYVVQWRGKGHLNDVDYGC